MHPLLGGVGVGFIRTIKISQLLMTLEQCSIELLNDAVSKLHVETAIWQQRTMIVAICSLHNHQQYLKELTQLFFALT